jgi:PKD repeat protein
MKKTIIKIGFALIIFLLITCIPSCTKTENQKLPVADFTFSPSSGYKPFTAIFSNTSENAESFSWDFGNGDYSNERNPSTTYLNDGVYSVTLTAKNSSGTNKITKSITVKKEPISVTIEDITIVDFPETDASGNNWDNSFSGSYPDVYFKIIDANSSELFKFSTTNRKENLRKVDLPYTFTSPANGFYTLTDLNKGFGITLYDYESIGTDQYMGGVLRNSAMLDLLSTGSLPSSFDFYYGDFFFNVKLKWNF